MFAKAHYDLNEKPLAVISENFFLLDSEAKRGKRDREKPIRDTALMGGVRVLF